MNRKKHIKGWLIALIGFVLLPLVTPVHAEDAVSLTPTPVAYQLPYPGLLPDHPFYFMRRVRDTVLNFFMSQPLKKADYKLQQSDKDMSAALTLMDKKKKSDLAAISLSEGVTSFEEAITAASDAKKQGISIDDFIQRLLIANLKHQEIARAFEKKSPQKFGKERKKLEELGKKVKALQKKK